jgi:LysR family transcriptional regulator, chromosome initiation inhibitor
VPPTGAPSRCAELNDVLLEIRVEDQDLSARLLGEVIVMGAVTTERTPAPGRRVHPLGVMCYLPVASQPFVERYLPDGFTAAGAAGAPSLVERRLGSDVIAVLSISVTRRRRRPSCR